jgi:hypothetical protein
VVLRAHAAVRPRCQFILDKAPNGIRLSSREEAPAPASGKATSTLPTPPSLFSSFHRIRPTPFDDTFVSLNTDIDAKNNTLCYSDFDTSFRARRSLVQKPSISTSHHRSSTPYVGLAAVYSLLAILDLRPLVHERCMNPCVPVLEGRALPEDGWG